VSKVFLLAFLFGFLWRLVVEAVCRGFASLFNSFISTSGHRRPYVHSLIN